MLDFKDVETSNTISDRTMCRNVDFEILHNGIFKTVVREFRVRLQRHRQTSNNINDWTMRRNLEFEILHIEIFETVYREHFVVDFEDIDI